jgi:hypothetical protein
MMRFFVAVLALALAVSAHSAEFQLKGLSLGSAAATACGSSEVTSNFDDIIKSSKPDAPALVEMGTTECKVDFATFGGSKLDGPANLLFVNDSLILIKLQLASLPLADFVDIYKALSDDYGKSKRTTSRPFVTDTWKQHGSTLILERAVKAWDDNDVLIVLRDDASYATYDAQFKANALQLKNLALRQKKQDMR